LRVSAYILPAASRDAAQPAGLGKPKLLLFTVVKPSLAGRKCPGFHCFHRKGKISLLRGRSPILPSPGHRRQARRTMTVLQLQRYFWVLVPANGFKLVNFWGFQTRTRNPDHGHRTRQPESSKFSNSFRVMRWLSPILGPGRTDKLEELCSDLGVAVASRKESPKSGLKGQLFQPAKTLLSAAATKGRSTPFHKQKWTTFCTPLDGFRAYLLLPRNALHL
jgi:hypothetical protein